MVNSTKAFITETFVKQNFFKCTLVSWIGFWKRKGTLVEKLVTSK